MEAESKTVEQLQPPADKRAMERSTIEFPYLDLQNSLEIADGVHQIGGSGCDWDQLAAHFKQAAQGGGFRLRLISAKLVGLVLYDRGRINLTSLGLRAVDPQQQKAALAEAFMNVPLYKAVYLKFRGGTLPPIAGLEREMVSMGVSKKQADKARQVFQRSAKFAGYFEFGADRLVAPASSMTAAAAPPPSPEPVAIDEGRRGGGGSDGGEGNYHPFIVGLLRKLPEPDSEWTARDRAKWLETASNIFDLMYTGANDGAIEVRFLKAEDEL